VTECFRCGSDEHLSRDCPNRTPGRTAPAPPPAEPGGSTWQLPPVDAAIARRHAAAIRQQHGWPDPGDAA